MVYEKSTELHSNRIKIAEVEVVEGSLLDKLYFFDLDLKGHYDLIVLGIQDNQISKRFIFNVNSFNHKIDLGDVLVVIGREEEIAKFAKEYGARYGK